MTARADSAGDCVSEMTLKNGGSTHGSATSDARESHTSSDAVTTAVATGKPAVSAVDKLKARSMRLIGRSKSKKKTLRKPSEAKSRLAATQQRVVHFRIPERLTAVDEEEGFTRANPFRRSSKFRQPLRRVSRAKGSPPPIHFARIHPVILEHPLEEELSQPNFDQLSSEGESEGEEERDGLPGCAVESRLRRVLETGASDGESTGDETSSSEDEETYTVLPATTVPAHVSSEAEEEEEEEENEDRHGCEEEVEEGTSRRASVARTATLIRRRSSYRASVRRGSRRLSSVGRRESLAKRRNSVSVRRSSVVAATVRRKSSAVPGYVVRRRSVAVRSPYDSSPSQQRRRRKKHRRPRRRPRKIVVIGDMCSGKTSLISAYCRDKFSEVYVPTILTSCMTDADVLGEKIELVVVEVAGRIDYAQFRHCAYHKMDLVILCYSSDNPSSLAAIRNHWLPELLQVAPKVPYILVGTKKDIRDEQVCEIELSQQSRMNLAKSTTDGPPQPPPAARGERFVTTSQGMEMAEAIGAKDFIECSAMYREGTRDVFESAAKLALRQSPRRKKKSSQRAETCTIL